MLGIRAPATRFNSHNVYICLDNRELVLRYATFAFLACAIAETRMNIQ